MGEESERRGGHRLGEEDTCEPGFGARFWPQLFLRCVPSSAQQLLNWAMMVLMYFHDPTGAFVRHKGFSLALLVFPWVLGLALTEVVRRSEGGVDSNGRGASNDLAAILGLDPVLPPRTFDDDLAKAER